MNEMDFQREDEIVHRLKNQLSIILGFSELLLEELAPDDPKRNDVGEIRSAAYVAMAQMPELSKRLSEGTTE